MELGGSWEHDFVFEMRVHVVKVCLLISAEAPQLERITAGTICDKWGASQTSKYLVVLVYSPTNGCYMCNQTLVSCG